ncbi:MAG TPA: hypothetical protein VIF37_20420 [Methylobacter sp.]|jgi:hypothetical protein
MDKQILVKYPDTRNLKILVLSHSWNPDQYKFLQASPTDRAIMTANLDKKKLKEILLNKSYRFTDSPFEPSSDRPIDEDKLTLGKLVDYLDKTYGTSDKPQFHRQKIEQIIGTDRAQYLIKANKSEYFKVLTHFSILSKVKKGWTYLLTNSPTTSKPSLSNNPIAFGTKSSKKVNDAIIQCFYSRLLEGMTEQDKKRYQILSPIKSLTSGFDGWLLMLDKAIQDLFSFKKQKLDGHDVDGCDESLLPDSNLAEAIINTSDQLFHILEQPWTESYRTDTLRATLIKCASINRAMNDVDAIINIQNEVIHSLPYEINILQHIKSESEILPAISCIFNEQLSNLPKDLIRCSKLVCESYVIASLPPEKPDEFSKRHMMPDCIAVSAALLYHDFLQKKELNLNIRGETNNRISVYKSISDFVKHTHASDILQTKSLNRHGLQEELFKYLTTRYSASIFGLSEFYPSQIGAEAHLKVRKAKLELHKEIYEFLKGISVKDACLCITNIHTSVDMTINPESYPFLASSHKNLTTDVCVTPLVAFLNYRESPNTPD